jgi:hypothetical protein
VEEEEKLATFMPLRLWRARMEERSLDIAAVVQQIPDFLLYKVKDPRALR